MTNPFGQFTAIDYEDAPGTDLKQMRATLAEIPGASSKYAGVGQLILLTR